jgi:hypothetical protein
MGLWGLYLTGESCFHVPRFSNEFEINSEIYTYCTDQEKGNIHVSG